MTHTEADCREMAELAYAECKGGDAGVPPQRIIDNLAAKFEAIMARAKCRWTKTKTQNLRPKTQTPCPSSPSTPRTRR